ncbi:histidine kinase [Ramlibacter sp. XY19]|uniref:sensor histidine kinase n=1 Tax=Ramlibacter paludis TaxID=2908000 RepID=UPI0023DB9B11|nr:histidine kinase [Ramlibacter paludis]MCG2594420.1 histidine kinase [Ramlibacter paludis]
METLSLPGWRKTLWPRLGFTLLVALGFALVFDRSRTPFAVWTMRTATVALVALLAFSVFEQWPRNPPRWLARWVLQLLGVLVAIPIGVLMAFGVHSGARVHEIMGDPAQRAGFYGLLGPGLLFGPWIAFAALVRQREAQARHQALAFQLERSELERQAVDARMRLLQAQVQPHFLFNTLANVRALVKAGSPRAPAVLDSLIAYLRAAMPGLGDADGTVAREIALVRAYLDLMHLRMPDRLQFSVHADEEAQDLRCPPMALLTLVENAVRHGIDPGEEGGRIDVSVTVREGRCIARVVDTGVGLEQGGSGTGTGLANLRERLRLSFGDAQVRLAANSPHGAVAEFEIPAQRSQA